MPSIEKKSSSGKAVKPTDMPDLTEIFSPAQLAQAITAKRTGMKLRLVDVAEALSISKQTLVKIEKGETKVNFINLLRVMEYLGLTFQVVTDESPSTMSQPSGEHSGEWF